MIAVDSLCGTYGGSPTTPGRSDTASRDRPFPARSTIPAPPTLLNQGRLT